MDIIKVAKMDVVKVAKTPGTVGPVISGWEDIRWGGGEGAKWPEVIEGDYGFSGGSGVSKPVTGDIKPGLIEGDLAFSGGDGEGGYVPSGWPKPAPEDDGGDSEGYITDGGWDAHSGDWGFKGDDDGAEELFARGEKWWKDGDKGTFGIGGGPSIIKHLGDTNIPKHEVPKNGDDQYDAATEYGGIILKVGSKHLSDPHNPRWPTGGGSGVCSTEYSGRTTEDINDPTWDIDGGDNDIIKTGSRIPVLWKDGSTWFGGSDYISGEGLLIDGTESLIDGGDDIGHTCPFVKTGFDGHTSTFGEKDFGVQPRT